VFLGPKFRRTAFYGFMGYQVFFFIMGTHGFLNVLCLVLSLCLLTDDDIKRFFSWIKLRFLKLKELPSLETLNQSKWQKGRSVIFQLFFVYIVLITVAYESQALFRSKAYSKITEILWKPIYNYHFVNIYRYFGAVPKQRRELLVMGSMDKKEWKEFELFAFPGRLSKAPSLPNVFVSRLDLLFWKISKEFPVPASKMNSILKSIAYANGNVMKGFKNPFPGQRPTYLQVLKYDYHFSSMSEKRKSGNWWKRDSKKGYFPAIQFR